MGDRHVRDGDEKQTGPGRYEGGAGEPIAVIGMGCRFAGGVNSPEAYWRMLMEGQDAIGAVPPERWASYAEVSPQHAAALRRVTRHGGFLDDIEGFDAEFFGITPREAELMDPQQRIVLEVSWEALEHAGIPPHTLAGGDTAVFVGVGSDDYGRRMLEDLPGIEAWTGIGAAYCAVANRVSHALDLRGPSLAVDTACSASLVSIHLAVQALRLGECPVALAGGVNIMAAPGLTLVLDAAGAVAPDGRSKSFDAAADGYGRGEGAGVVVLKRLVDARRDGDRVLAVIRGSAVHQDGRTNGIMAPSTEAQAHLLRRAYRNAGVDPLTVDYVEAHGTGTRAGDPVETAAMGEVFGAGRPADRPCLIGSVKPNIGHLEAGAGVAGLIKAVLALHYGHLPPQANFSTPNPAIPWDRMGLRVVAEPTPWPAGDRPRRAGVSGYGYGGTIGHIVLEDAPEPDPGSEAVSEPHRAGQAAECAAPRVFPLGAAGLPGLRAGAAALADWLSAEGADTPLDDVVRTLTVHRDPAPARAAVTATDREQLMARLRAFAVSEDDLPTEGVESARVLPDAGRGAVWVFSGHGSQWVGMGRELLAEESAFAKVMDEIEPVFLDEIGFSPRRALQDGDLHEVDRIQPVIFAMQVALAAVWRERGLAPAAVIGHSVGEIAAAVVAGVLELADGARLVCRRSALLRRVAGRGAMIMVGLPFDDVARQLAGRADATAAIAASPLSTVVAGDIAAVEELAARWRDSSLSVHRVASDVAFHSAHMDPLLAELRDAATGLTPSRPRVPLYSTALADPRDSALRDGAYWAANLREPVRFAQAVAAAVEDGHRAFVEVSGHPVVAHSLAETLAERGIEDAVVAHTLRRGRAERETLLGNLALLHCHGVPVDWAGVTPGRAADLPRTVWQHRRFWYESTRGPAVTGTAHDVAGHTLLGGRVDVLGSTPARLWRTFLDASCRPYPGDHPVQGVEIVPATVLLNTFLTAATDGREPPGLADVTLRVPVAVSTPRELQVVLQEGTIRLTSRILARDAAAGEPDTDVSWLTHTTAVVSPGTRVEDRVLDVTALRGRCAERLDVGFVVERLASVGVAAMGFPWVIRELRRTDGELFAEVSASPDDTPPTSWGSVLDAALSIASVVFPGEPVLRMPAHIREVAVHGGCPARVLLHVRTGDGTSAADTVDVTVADLDGRPVARLAGLHYGLLEGDPGTTASPRRLVSEPAWRSLALPEAPTNRSAPATSAVVVGDPTAGPQLAAALTEAGLPCTAIGTSQELDVPLSPGTAVIVVPGGTPEVGDVPVAATEGAWLMTQAVRRLASTAPSLRLSLWCVTRGVREARTPNALADAPLWGLGRVVGGEHPELWGGVLDLPEQPTPETWTALAEAVRALPGEDVIALPGGAVNAPPGTHASPPRGSGAEVPRLVPVEREPVRPALACRPDGTYLITGGLGVLGLEVAAWLAGRGARRLVLASRHGLPPRQSWAAQTDPRVLRRIDAVRALESLGVGVHVVAVDVGDPAALASALAPEALDLPPIRGVVHAAGVLDDRLVSAVDEESLARVMRPKVEGALALHQLFPPGSVDFFTLFSSCGQLLGITGQGSYASGNAFLDALAAHRAAQGDAGTVSIAWTSWRGLGMSTSSQVIDAELAARGTADISAAEAFRSWEFISRHAAPYFVVLRGNRAEAPLVRVPLLEELAARTPDSASEEGTQPAWASLPPQELVALVEAEVRESVAAELKWSPSELDARRPLMEMGLDSVMALVIRRRLEKRFRLALPTTLLWDHPTMAAIAGYLAERLTA
ncbi:beta-ketoacyl synthase N-terminal-like domain-containing protein [Streptomyces sp. NPDC005820]|uniref:type I polyketide synthase n=1 Tax=Streptomyces sp. NPDC005820 TaxID=3157069 RepID=UPI0033DA0F68